MSDQDSLLNDDFLLSTRPPTTHHLTTATTRYHPLPFYTQTHPKDFFFFSPVIGLPPPARLFVMRKVVLMHTTNTVDVVIVTSYFSFLFLFI